MHIDRVQLFASSISRWSCGLAGYRFDQIAPLFVNAPANVILPEPFRVILIASPPD